MSMFTKDFTYLEAWLPGLPGMLEERGMADLSGLPEPLAPSQLTASQAFSIVLSPPHTLVTASPLRMLSKIRYSRRGATRYQDVSEKSPQHGKNTKASLGQECSRPVVLKM